MEPHVLVSHLAREEVTRGEERFRDASAAVFVRDGHVAQVRRVRWRGRLGLRGAPRRGSAAGGFGEGEGRDGDGFVRGVVEDGDEAYLFGVGVELVEEVLGDARAGSLVRCASERVHHHGRECADVRLAHRAEGDGGAVLERDGGTLERGLDRDEAIM